MALTRLGGVPLRMLIVDDGQDFRHLFRMTLLRVPGLPHAVCVEPEDRAAAVGAAREACPDLAIMDEGTPGIAIRARPGSLPRPGAARWSARFQFLDLGSKLL